MIEYGLLKISVGTLIPLDWVQRNLGKLNPKEIKANGETYPPGTACLAQVSHVSDGRSLLFFAIDPDGWEEHFKDREFKRRFLKKEVPVMVPTINPAQEVPNPFSDVNLW